jgi:O-antigen biosynthesis protein
MLHAPSKSGILLKIGDVSDIAPAPSEDDFAAWHTKQPLTNSGTSYDASRCTFTVVVVMPLFATLGQIQATLSSLSRQRYCNYETVLLRPHRCSDDLLDDVRASQPSGAHLILEVDNWRMALAVSFGTMVAVVEAGDVLSPWALADVGRSASSFTDPAVLIYSDNDHVREGYSNDPILKPGWSPVFLRHFNYIGTTWFAGRDAFLQVLAEGSEPEDIWELLVKIGAKSTAVCHIPAVLYSTSRVGDEANAPTENLDQPEGQFDDPLVSVIIPTCLKDDDCLRRCLTGLIEQTNYARLDVVVVLNNLPSQIPASHWLYRSPVTVMEWDHPFNWSAINNFAAAKAAGDLLLFLNDDIEVLQPDWLRKLVRLISETGAGAVGPLLTFPDGRIQHVGMGLVYHGGGTQHLFRSGDRNTGNASWLTRHPREVSSITGACMLVSRTSFEQVHGFDEQFGLVNNDSDFCLRLGRTGNPVLIEPRAELIHHEGLSRAGLPEMDDVLRFWSRWEEVLRLGDFFGNPNLDFAKSNWEVDPAMARRHLPRVSLRSRFGQHMNQHGTEGMVDVPISRRNG